VLFDLPDVTAAQYDDLTTKLTSGRGQRNLSDMPVKRTSVARSWPNAEWLARRRSVGVGRRI
jgi:hypothetical protein